MSSWDRSRRIPWTKIQQGYNNNNNNEESPEKYRERIQEEIRRDVATAAEEQASKNSTAQSINNLASSDVVDGSTNEDDVSWKKKIFRGKTYATSDLLRQFAFGGCVGTLTGATFGFMDSIKQAQESSILKRASNSAKGRFMLQGTTRSAFIFGSFFGSFQVAKYGMRVISDPGPFTEIGVAGIFSLSLLAIKPATRPSIPYGAMLIVMDTSPWSKITIDISKMTFIKKLEERLEKLSDELEDIHLEAAIDAQLTHVIVPSTTNNEDSNNRNTTNITTTTSNEEEENNKTRPKKDVIFDDYSNPNAVLNCLSPYVPCKAKQVDAFFLQSGLGKLLSNKKDHVLLDVGCGDGRVCISAVQMFGCRAVGIDVSPPCISMARNIRKEEGISDTQCQFFQVDATTNPNHLFSEKSSLCNILNSVTVIFLYVYPTLMTKLVPFLARMTDGTTSTTRLIATVTYHIDNTNAVVKWKDDIHDICYYSQVFDSSTTTTAATATR